MSIRYCKCPKCGGLVSLYNPPAQSGGEGCKVKQIKGCLTKKEIADTSANWIPLTINVNGTTIPNEEDTKVPSVCPQCGHAEAVIRHHSYTATDRRGTQERVEVQLVCASPLVDDYRECALCATRTTTSIPEGLPW